MREKLIELVGQVQDCGCDVTDVVEMNYVENITLVDHLVANGVTAQKWIPVTERLPEHDGRYLCNVKSFAFKGSCYITMLKYDKGGFIEGHIYTDDVTHWMELPQPPKGEWVWEKS